MENRDFKLRSSGFPACRSRSWSLLLGLLLILAFALRVNAQSPPPSLFFTDLDSGQNSGGETVAGFSGAYVTLYGNFFGTFQASSTVTWNGLNCLRVVPATGSYSGWGSAYFWYQKIVVQLGPSCAPGTGNFVVTVDGLASNGISFTVRTAGHIYFAATTGNDSSGSGSATSPFRSVVGCKSHEAAGDICYIQNGVTDTGTDNFDATVNIDRAGTAGNPIAIVAYPGATAGIHAGTGTTYGVRVANVGIAQSYWTIAGLSIEADSGGGQAMNPTQNSTQWRVIGNLFQCPNANGEDGCFTTNEVTYLYFYGNETTNTGTTGASKQQHADYFSSDTNHVRVGWNYIHDNRSCRAIQFHSSPLGGGGPGDPTGHQQFDLSVHDNLIHDDPCDGINLATVDPSQGKVEVYNNLIYHVGLGPDPSDGEASYNCLYFPQILNTGPAGSGTVEIYNNTMYDCGSHLGTFNLSGTISISPGPLSFDFRNNIGYQLGGEFYNNSGAPPGATVTGSNNIWFGGSQSAPSFTTGNITVNPQLSAPAAGNFHLLKGSPAVDAGVAISSSNSHGGYQVWNGIPMDHEGVSRPQGSAFDIGAYEYFAGATKATSATLVTLTGGTDPSSPAQALTFTARVTPQFAGTPTGFVQFKDNGANLGSPVSLTGGTGSFTTTALSSGLHSITAIYGGDVAFTGSASPVFTQVVASGGSPSTTALSLNGATGQTTLYFGVVAGVQGANFVVQITPSTATGDVVILAENAQLGPVLTLSSGQARYSTQLPIGLHHVLAIYVGDGTVAGSASPIVIIHRSPRPKPR